MMVSRRNYLFAFILALSVTACSSSIYGEWQGDRAEMQIIDENQLSGAQIDDFNRNVDQLEERLEASIKATSLKIEEGKVTFTFNCKDHPEVTVPAQATIDEDNQKITLNKIEASEDYLQENSAALLECDVYLRSGDVDETIQYEVNGLHLNMIR